MTRYFLREDFEGLNRKIEEILKEQRKAGQSMGESTRQGAETFHDNAPFDAAQEHFGLLAVQLRELIKMRESARILSEENFPKGKVGFGRTITVLNLETGKENRWRIGSYRSFVEQSSEDPTPLSYGSPLVRLLQGAVEGEERQGEIGKHRQRFRIIRIT